MSEKDQKTRDEILDYLKSEGYVIGRRANEGCKLAASVMKNYNLWHKLPKDMMAMTLTEIAIEDYKAKWNPKRKGSSL